MKNSEEKKQLIEFPCDFSIKVIGKDCPDFLNSVSEIMRSLVLLSGILSIDSAKHISATPSWLSKPYSLRNASNFVRSFLFSLQATIIYVV